MPNKKSNHSINKGKVEKAYTLILEFSLEEIEMLMEKLTSRKNNLAGNDPNRNRSTISL